MADFPSAVASDGSLLIAANNVSSTLNGGISAAASSATLASTVNFPTKGGITIETEAILYAGNNTATSVLSGLTRGADSTTAAIHADGTSVFMHMQARHHNALKDEVIATEQNLKDRLGLSATDIFTTVDFTDYSAVSTITGWSSFTTQLIYYKKVGKVIFVWFDLVGTSNSTTTRFTLPYALANAVNVNLVIRAQDNGSFLTSALMQAVKNTSTVDFYKDMVGNSFTGSGGKTVQGAFFYQSV